MPLSPVPLLHSHPFGGFGVKQSVEFPALKKHLPVVVAATAGVVLSIVTFFLVKEREQSLIDVEFERRASVHISAMRNTVDQNLEVLQSIGRLYAASGEVERHHFRDFVEGALLGFTGIQALVWVPWVDGSERESYEQIARDDGFAEFGFTERVAEGQIGPAGERLNHLPVFYLEPQRGSEVPLGFDLASDDSVRTALGKKGRETRYRWSRPRLSLWRRKVTTVAAF